MNICKSVYLSMSISLSLWLSCRDKLFQRKMKVNDGNKKGYVYQEEL